MAFKKMAIGMACVLALVAMSGLAVADKAPAEVDIIPHDIINPLDGSTVTNATVKVYNISYSREGNKHSRHISVVTNNPNLNARIVNASVIDKTSQGGDGTGVDTNWTNITRQGDNYTAEKPNVYYFTLQVKGTSPGQITVYDNSGREWDVTAGHDSASVTSPVDIPEFPLGIIIPAAISLGIIFLVFRRRQKD